MKRPTNVDEIRNPIFSGRVDLSLIEAMWPGKSYWFMADHEILEERLKLVNSVRLGDSASIKVARGECDLTKHRSRISSNHKMTLSAVIISIDLWSGVHLMAIRKRLSI